jgi:hypothetical protein
MNRLDLIIDALELAIETSEFERVNSAYRQALAAARELRDLTPVGYMDSKGVLFNDTTHPHLNTPLYALDEVKHD